MKKRLLRLLFLLLLSFCLPTNISADEKIDLKCNDEEEMVICNLLGTASEEIVAIEADIIYDNNLKLLKLVNDNLWLGDASNDFISLYGLGTGDSRDFNIGILQFKKINNKSTKSYVSLNNIKFSGTDYKWKKLDNVTSNFEIKYSSTMEEKKNLINFQLILLILGILLILCFLFVIILYCIKHINDNSKIYIKRKQIIITLIILLMIIFCVYFFASSGKLLFNKNVLDYTCNQYDGILQCRVYGNVNYDITAIEMEFSLNKENKVELVNTYEWQNYYKGDKLDLFTSYDVNGKFDLCEFKIYGYKNDGNIKIKNINFIDKDGYNHLIDDINIKSVEE